jgi:hypothetical protein
VNLSQRLPVDLAFLEGPLQRSGQFFPEHDVRAIGPKFLMVIDLLLQEGTRKKNSAAAIHQFIHDDLDKLRRLAASVRRKVGVMKLNAVRSLGCV